MDRIPCSLNDNNAVWIYQQKPHHGESIEELKHLLFRASLELERTRANAETQSQLQEARILHLQELLTDARRERDEVREQLLALNQRLTECSKLKNSQHYAMSSDRSQWPDTRLAAAEPDELNTSTTGTATVATMHSNSSPLAGLADQFRRNSAGHYCDFAQLDLRPNLDLHQTSTSSSNAHCSNRMELQEQPFYHHNEQRLSFLERQVSEQQHQFESRLPHLVQDKSTDCDFWQQQQQEAGEAGIRQPSNLFPRIGAEPSAGGHMTSHDPKPGLVLASSPSILGPTSSAMAAYLPEPPESDLHVMLSTLPERGKLLQAVMQAGPLLQTLLLAGPLPEWKHPPPALDTVEIPRISMCPSPNSLPVGPMTHHVHSPHSPAAVLDSLQVNSPLSSSHKSLSPSTRISEPPSGAFITSLQSGSAAASSSSKLLCSPTFKSQDSAITVGPPLKFAEIR